MSNTDWIQSPSNTFLPSVCKRLNIWQFDSDIYVCSSVYVSDWIQSFSSASIPEWIFCICFSITPPSDFILHPLLTEFSHLVTSTYAANLLRYKKCERCLLSHVLHESLFNSSSTPVVYLFHINYALKRALLSQLVCTCNVCGSCKQFGSPGGSYWLNSVTSLEVLTQCILVWHERHTLYSTKVLNLDSTRLLSAACIVWGSAHVRIEFNVAVLTEVSQPFWPSLCSNIYILLFSPFCVKPIIRYFRRWRNSVRLWGIHVYNRQCSNPSDRDTFVIFYSCGVLVWNDIYSSLLAFSGEINFRH